MRDDMGIVAIVAQPLGEAGEFVGDLAGERVDGFFRPEPFGLHKSRPQQIAFVGVAQIVEREAMHLGDGVGPVGVNLDRLHIGDDQQRRVFERHGILLKLGESGLQILALALVFPAEATALPDIRPTLAAGGFRGAALETIIFALLIGVGGVFDPEELAQVDEMRLRGRAFFEGGSAPFIDKLIGGHGIGLR